MKFKMCMYGCYVHGQDCIQTAFPDVSVSLREIICMFWTQKKKIFRDCFKLHILLHEALQSHASFGLNFRVAVKVVMS